MRVIDRLRQVLAGMDMKTKDAHDLFEQAIIDAARRIAKTARGFGTENRITTFFQVMGENYRIRIERIPNDGKGVSSAGN